MKPVEATLAVRVTPRSGSNQVIISEDFQVTVRTTSPPADGKANQSVIETLAKTFSLPKSSISIKSGAASRNKIVVFSGINDTEMQQMIAIMYKSMPETSTK